MEHHRGRTLDHIHLVVRDLEKSKTFYRAALEPLARTLTTESPTHFSCDELFVSPKEEDFQRYSVVHLAFLAEDRAAVVAFHEAAISAGGKDNGAPGERNQYHPGYYGAFVLDPDGNNVEAVFHGPAKRSAPSVVFTPL